MSGTDIKSKYLKATARDTSQCLQYVTDFFGAYGDDPVAEIVFQGQTEEAFTERKLTDKDLEKIVSSAEPAGRFAKIDLRNNKLGSPAISSLSSLLVSSGSYVCKVKELCLRGNNIGPDGCRELCTALKSNKTVEKLDLANNPIGNEGGFSVAGLISATEDSLLSEIQIGNTELAQEAVSAIAAAMWTNKSITALDLSRPRLFSLQQETSLHLARMLGVNSVLQEISLAKHSIRDEGAQYISECLLSAKNSSLASLDLSGNQIGISGGKHLALLLANSSTIRKLSLAGNAIGDEGARAIAVALRDHNTTLTSLDLSSNGIGEAGLVAIAEALMQGTTPLGELRLWGNTFGQRSAGSFHRLFNEGRLKYFIKSTDIFPTVNEGVFQIARDTSRQRYMGSSVVEN